MVLLLFVTTNKANPINPTANKIGNKEMMEKANNSNPDSLTKFSFFVLLQMSQPINARTILLIVSIVDMLSAIKNGSGL
jgi:hypothetical protein